MFKSFGMAVLLSTSVFSSGAQAENPTTGGLEIAPTPLDMMALMSTYLGGEVSAQQLFNMGVEANMRIPMEHLRVQFTDLRTGIGMSRNDIAAILGQSRQEWSHELLLRTMNTFVLPGITSEQLIDLFDAASLASMRNPPDYLNVEFYDVRLGVAELSDGGVSGSLPSKKHTPSEALEAVGNDWNDQTVIDFFVANEQKFKPQDEFEFVLPYSAVAASLKDLNRVTREEFALFLENEPELGVDFVNHNAPFFTQAAVGTEGDMRRYIGLLYIKAENKEIADQMREMYAKIYGL